VIERWDRVRSAARQGAAGIWALLLLVGLVACSASVAMAAGPVKIGGLTESWGPNPHMVGLRDGLVALGYRENEHFVIAVRFTRGEVGAVSAAARDLVQQGADILFPTGGGALAAAHAATSSVPIVFAGAGDDPVRRRLVKSFARPGGNITGVVDLGPELAGKRLEIFRELIPRLKRVVFVYAANDAYSVLEAQAYRDAARQLGVELVERPVADQPQAQAAFAKLRKPDVHGIVVPYSIAWNVPGHARDFAMNHGIPTMFPASFFVQEGGLASYGADYYATGRQAARLVDKIIKGAKPGDIPVESNPRIELVINLKAARQLGVEIPTAVRTRADRFVE
jgi:putative tryptophan/tyrosine transport system substrate-binding protein